MFALKAILDGSRAAQYFAKDRTAIKAKCDELQAQIESKKSRELLFNEFIKTVKQCKTPIAEFDEKLWVIVVDYMEVGETIRIVFKCGL